MKFIFLVSCIVICASTASAKCGFSWRKGVGITSDFGVRVNRAIDCMEERIAKIEAENTKLLARLNEYEDIIAQVPKEFFNMDGETNNALSPYSKANFTLSSSRRGRIASLEVEHVVLLDLCADAEGCHVRISNKGEQSSDEKSCNLKYLEDTGEWKLSPDCGGVSGTDGDGRLPGAGNVVGSVLMNIANDCALTESDVSLNTDENGLPKLARDRNEGLFLLNGYPVEAGADSGDHETCLLTFRD